MNGFRTNSATFVQNCRQTNSCDNTELLKGTLKNTVENVPYFHGTCHNDMATVPCHCSATDMSKTRTFLDVSI